MARNEGLSKYGYIYLASPYSHKDRRIRHARFERITKISTELFKRKEICFCPITQGHPQHTLDDDLPRTWDFWSDVDFRFVKNSEKVYVATMQGWEQSVGVQAEIVFAKENNIPVYYINPNTLVVTEEPD